MLSPDQEPVNEVLSRYDIKVSGIELNSFKGKKGVWKIQTTRGAKYLKKVSNSEKTLKYLLSAVSYLSGKGVRLPKVIRTKKGEEYVTIKGICYVLSDGVEGVPPRYSSAQELIKIVKGLAEFHRDSKGFSPPPETKPKNRLGKWIDEYSQQIDFMNEFYVYEKNFKKNGAFGKIIVDEFPYFFERAQKVIEALKGPEYSGWVDKVAKEGGLCHQDFASGNLLIDPSGRLNVLDTDGILIDLAAKDIRKLLNKVMKKAGKWDKELAEAILSCYQSVNPLTPSEWEVVKLDITYPHLFLGCMAKFYYNRDPQWSIEKYLYKIRAMTAVEKSSVQILEGFDTFVKDSLLVKPFNEAVLVNAVNRVEKNLLFGISGRKTTAVYQKRGPLKIRRFVKRVQSRIPILKLLRFKG